MKFTVLKGAGKKIKKKCFCVISDVSGKFSSLNSPDWTGCPGGPGGSGAPGGPGGRVTGSGAGRTQQERLQEPATNTIY